MKNTKIGTASTTAGAHKYKAAVIDSAGNYGPFTDEVLCVGENPFAAAEFNTISFGIPDPANLSGYLSPGLNAVKIGVWEDGVFYKDVNSFNREVTQMQIIRDNSAATTAPAGTQTLSYNVPWINGQITTTLDSDATTINDSTLSYKVLAVNEKGEESEASEATQAVQDLTAGQYVTLYFAPPKSANVGIGSSSATGQAAHVGVTLGTFFRIASKPAWKRIVTSTSDTLSTSSAYSWTDENGNVLGTSSTLLLTSAHLGKIITFTVTISSTVDGTSTVLGSASVSWANTVKNSGNPSEVPVSYPPLYTYKIYRSKDGGQFQYIGTTKALIFNDKNATASTSLPDKPTLFAAAGDYPGAVAYHQQRLVFAGSTNNPMTLWFSKVADSTNFSTHSPLIDDDAITITIAANETNQIQHLVPLNDLLVLTSGSEWRIGGNQASDAITPANIAAVPQGNRGSAMLRPLAIGTKTLFLQRLSKTVRAMAYSWEADGFESQDLTLLADHLMEGYTITDWAFAQSPIPQLYALRSDGLLLVCTILPEQDVIAWSRIKLDFPIQAVCVIPENGRDTLYLAAQSFRKEKTSGVYTRYTDSSLIRLEEFAQTQTSANGLDFFLEYNAPVVTTVISTTVGNSVPSPGVGLEVTTTSRVKVATATSMIGTITAGDSVMIEGMSGFALVYGGVEQKWMHAPAGPDSWLNGKAFIVERVDANGLVLTTDLTGLVPSIDEAEGLNNSFTPWISGGTIKKGVTQVTGLDHLRGRWSTIVADGQPRGTAKVNPDTAAAAAFNVSYSVYPPAFHVVIGLPFVAEVKTLPVGGQLVPGGRRRISACRVRVRDTAGLEVAPDLGDGDEVALWGPVRPNDGSTDLTDAGQTLKSFVFSQKVDPNWSTEGGLRLRSLSPLPCNILSIIPEVEIGN